MDHPFQSYYAALPPCRAVRLMEIDAIIIGLFPDVTRSMKYRMPTYETPAGFIAAGNQKNHIAVYACSEEMIAPYIKTHPSTAHGKGCLRFTNKTALHIPALCKVLTKALSEP